jgi:hypothetical protein
MPLINGSGINEQKGPDTASSRSDVVVSKRCSIKKDAVPTVKGQRNFLI